MTVSPDNFADLQETRRIRGGLCVGPTDAAATFPHGGTSLGLVTNLRFRVAPIRAEITAEELHGMTWDVIEGGERCVVAAMMHTYSDAVVAALFPGVTTALDSGKPRISRTTTTTTGSLGSARAVKLLFSPQDTETHPAFYLPHAVPLIEESFDLAYSLQLDWGMPLIFLALPDASGVLYKHEMLETLVV